VTNAPTPDAARAEFVRLLVERHGLAPEAAERVADLVKHQRNRRPDPEESENTDPTDDAAEPDARAALRGALFTHVKDGIESGEIEDPFKNRYSRGRRDEWLRDAVTETVDDVYGGGEIPLYRGLFIVNERGLGDAQDARVVADSIAESGHTGDFWAAHEDAAYSWDEGQVRNVLLEARASPADVDLVATVVARVRFPDEREIILAEGRARLTRVAVQPDVALSAADVAEEYDIGAFSAIESEVESILDGETIQEAIDGDPDAQRALAVAVEQACGYYGIEGYAYDEFDDEFVYDGDPAAEEFNVFQNAPWENVLAEPMDVTWEGGGDAYAPDERPEWSRAGPSLDEKGRPVVPGKKSGSGKGRGWWGDAERHSKAARTGKADFLTDDVNDAPFHRDLKRVIDAYKDLEYKPPVFDVSEAFFDGFTSDVLADIQSDENPVEVDRFHDWVNEAHEGFVIRNKNYLYFRGRNLGNVHKLRRIHGYTPTGNALTTIALILKHADPRPRGRGTTYFNFNTARFTKDPPFYEVAETASPEALREEKRQTEEMEAQARAAELEDNRAEALRAREERLRAERETQELLENAREAKRERAREQRRARARERRQAYKESVRERLEKERGHLGPIYLNKFNSELERRENAWKAAETKVSGGAGKGRGWWGDAARHSKAARTGKADFCPVAARRVHARILTDDALPDAPLSLQVQELVETALPAVAQKNPDADEESLLLAAYELVREEHPVTQDFAPLYTYEVLSPDELAGAPFNIQDDLATRACVAATKWVSQVANDFITDDDDVLYGEPAFHRADRQAFNVPLQALPRVATGGKSSSSNIAGIGYENGVLLVEFNNGAVYSYDVGPRTFQAFARAPSKGQFLWNSLRGYAPGVVIDNPSKRTPGGVGGSLVVYWKERQQAGRSGPGTSDEEMRATIEKYTQFKRKIPPGAPGYRAPAPPKPPSGPKPPRGIPGLTTGTRARVSQAVAMAEEKRSGRRAARERARRALVAQLRRVKTRTMPAGRATPPSTPSAPPAPDEPAARDPDADEDLPAAKDANKAAREVLQARADQLRAALQFDLPDAIRDALREALNVLRARLAKLASDFAEPPITVTDDAVALSGPLTRAGPFEYATGVRYKDWDNLKHAFRHIKHVPAFNSHDEKELVGFVPGASLRFNDSTRQVVGRVILFDDVAASLPPDAESLEFPVSFRYEDDAPPDSATQHVGRVYHLAVSLDRRDRDRCSTAGGAPCRVRAAPPDRSNLQQVFIPMSTHTYRKRTRDDADDAPPEKREKKDEEKKDDEEDDEDEKMNEDFVQVPKGEYEALQRAARLADEQQAKFRAMEDFISELKAEQEAARVKRAATLRAELEKHPAIRADFLEDKDLAALEMLEKALKPASALQPGGRGTTASGVDVWERLAADFKSAAEDNESALKARWKVK
jgi:hypothetical protein